MSAPDPLAQLAERLFRAAREEPLPERALQQALSVARSEAARFTTGRARWSTAARLSLMSAAVAAAAGLALLMRHTDLGERISAEPASTMIPGRAQQSPLASAAVSMPTPPAVLSARAASVPVAISAAHPAQASLSDELAALKRASSALSNGDTRAALTALDQYDHVLKGTKMRAEATLLRIETLAKAGQPDAASALAQRFVAQNPDSPLVDRARSFVQ